MSIDQGDAIGSKTVYSRGSYVVVPQGHELPNRCIKCNAPVVGPLISHRLKWWHSADREQSAGFLFVPFVGGLFRWVNQWLTVKTAIICFGLCQRHKALRWICLCFATILAAAAVAIPVLTFDRHTSILPFLAIPVVLLASMILFVWALQPVRAQYIDQTQTIIRGACKEFIAQLPSEASRAAAAQGATSLRATAQRKPRM
jgi:hypothetical protein